MKYLMGFLFSLIPALIVGAITYPFFGAGALLFADAVFVLGMDVCFNGRDRTPGVGACPECGRFYPVHLPGCPHGMEAAGPATVSWRWSGSGYLLMRNGVPISGDEAVALIAGVGEVPRG